MQKKVITKIVLKSGTVFPTGYKQTLGEGSEVLLQEKWEVSENHHRPHPDIFSVVDEFKIHFARKLFHHQVGGLKNAELLEVPGIRGSLERTKLSLIEKVVKGSGPAIKIVGQIKAEYGSANKAEIVIPVDETSPYLFAPELEKLWNRLAEEGQLYNDQLKYNEETVPMEEQPKLFSDEEGGAEMEAQVMQ